MELDFNLDKSRGHRSPPNPKFESIGGVTEINPELVRQPGRSKTVFTATVDQSEDRAEVASAIRTGTTGRKIGKPRRSGSSWRYSKSQPWGEK